MASHIVLEEIGKPYGTKAVHILNEEHKSDAYLKINPQARIPALIADGKILTETVAILTFLAKRHPESNLLPADVFQAAQCLSIMTWLSCAVHPSFRHFGRPERFSDDPVAYQSIKEKGKETFWAHCHEIDTLLAGKQWVMGDQYTVCDPYVLVFYGWFFLPERPINLPLMEVPNYTRFVQHMLKRPAVRAVVEREQSPLMRLI